MLDIRQFRDEPDVVRAGLTRRGEDPSIVEQIVEIDGFWREDLTRLEALRAQRNTGSKEVAAARDPEARAQLIETMRQVSNEVGSLEKAVDTHALARDEALMRVPNLPVAEVPDGASDAENVVLRQSGEATRAAHARPHWEIGPELGILDFERGVRLAGSRFYVLFREGARLQRALIHWMLDYHTANGYEEVYPPFVVRESCMWNAGQLPKFADNLYHDVEDDLWLVPTAEVPITNLHAGEILEDADLPRRYAAYTACFRRERMSAGRDVRGIKRGHQFDKVEIYQFTRPEDSDAALEAMLAEAEGMLRALGLAYRVVAVCSGDLGFSARQTFDLEIWSSGSEEWLEVSSVSNVGAFQARRAGIRFRRAAGAATEPVHTLNASGLALPRTVAALLENGYTAGGRIELPEALHHWFGATTI